MKIGVDIDGVIVDTIRLCSKEFSKHFGYDITCEDITCRFEQIEGGQEFINQNLEYLFCSLPPYEDAVEALNYLHKEHEIYFVSSRRDFTYDKTIDWFEKHGILPRKLYLTGGKPKVQCCKELGIEVFIEDSTAYASDIIESGIPVIIFKTEYNQALKNDMFIYCDNWKEIVNTIFELC